MKAMVCNEYGPVESLVYGELPLPEPGPKQVLIDVYAAGVNFPDSLIVQGKYQFKPSFPFSPGGEVAGIVRSIGSEVTSVNIGDRVLAPVGWGGYAESALAEEWRVLKIPDDMPYDVASGFIVTYGTSYHALKNRAQLKPGETMLVLGAAGGVGLAAVELGKAMGAKVIAAASTDDKLQICKDHGADILLNYSREDLRERLKELTDGRGVDVAYDPVGGDLCEPALRSVGWNGRYLVVGFAAGTIPRPPLNLPLLKGSAILGVFWGAFARNEPEQNAINATELFDLYRAGKIKPHICARYSLDQATEALRYVTERQAKGKVILDVRGDDG